MLVRWLTWRQPSGLQLAGRAGGLRPPGRGAGHAARRSGGRGKRRSPRCAGCRCGAAPERSRQPGR
ncbi:hypothetical protein MJ571_02075 [Klebsiella pneumoniae]|nr:hypothetical protein MJ571_02075 [Klebsiella pneumoniae]